MQFNDFTLAAGRIHSRRRHDSTALAISAVELCSKMLTRLRAGEIEVGHGIRGMPEFFVSLGVPSSLHDQLGERVEHPGRIFSVRAADIEEPFQINVVLSSVDLSSDDLAVGTVVAMSGSFGGASADHEVFEATVQELLLKRPLLATAINPFTGSDFNTIKIAGDFSTCFAAALLLE